jgi:3-oxoacyl-[acyl-carrier protein] reductase
VRLLVSLGARVGCGYCKSGERAQRLADELNVSSAVVFPVRMDVTDASQVEASVASVAKHFGEPVTVLVNNAGDLSEPQSIESMSEEMWSAEVRLNLTSAFLCSKHCIPGMKAKQHGRIINNTSLAARAGGGPGYVHYATCKGGMEAFTRGLAKELGPFGITVNAVAPGVIDTAIHGRSNTAGDLDAIRERTPVGRLGRPEDVAVVIAFLAAKEASYVTGVTIAANGGLRMG